MVADRENRLGQTKEVSLPPLVSSSVLSETVNHWKEQIVGDVLIIACGIVPHAGDAQKSLHRLRENSSIEADLQSQTKTFIRQIIRDHFLDFLSIQAHLRPCQGDERMNLMVVHLLHHSATQQSSLGVANQVISV